MDKRQYGKYRLLPAMILLGAAALFTACASISIESARDPGFSGKISRLYVLIRDNGQLKSSYSQNLQRALTERLSARGIVSQVQIVSSLELDESRYSRDIKTFSPDAVLSIQWAGGTRRLSEVIEVFWDASLHIPQTRTRIWRATIHLSGGSSLSRMTAMTDSILSRLEQDGIIAPAGKAVQKPEGAVPAPAPGKPEGGEVK
jgi:hypothetical protein